MTRIETALTEAMTTGDMDEPSAWATIRGQRELLRPAGIAPRMLATPTGQALAALVEAALEWRWVPESPDWGATGQDLDYSDLCAAVDAFRAATEPQPAGGEPDE